MTNLPCDFVAERVELERYGKVAALVEPPEGGGSGGAARPAGLWARRRLHPDVLLGGLRAERRHLSRQDLGLRRRRHSVASALVGRQRNKKVLSSKCWN